MDRCIQQRSMEMRMACSGAWPLRLLLSRASSVAVTGSATPLEIRFSNCRTAPPAGLDQLGRELMERWGLEIDIPGYKGPTVSKPPPPF